MRKAHVFSNISRFIDDQCTFNNDESEKNFKNIYYDK